MKPKLAIAITFLALVLFLDSKLVFAEYPDPNKPITIIVMAPPGGTLDTQLRAIAPYLSKHLGGVRIQVENIPGASGKIAYEKTYKAKSDGYTFLNYNLPSPIITELLEKDVRYKTMDFVPIYAISALPFVLVVHAENWNTVDEFIQEGQKRRVTIGSTGNKTANYLQALAFVEATKIRATLVPFGGGAESTQALAGKHIDANISPVLTALPLVRAGKFRPLFVFSNEPDSTYPGVLLSKGGKWDIATFPLINAFVGPPNLSPDKVKVLEESFSKALKEPAFVVWAAKVNLDPIPMNSKKVKDITINAYENMVKYESYFPKD